MKTRNYLLVISVLLMTSVPVLADAGRHKDLPWNRIFQSLLRSHALIILLLIWFFALLSWLLTRNRKKFFKRFALYRGFQFSEKDGINLSESLTELGAYSSKFKVNFKAQNIVTGNDWDGDLHIFDYSFKMGHGRTTYSACLFKLKNDLGMSLVLRKRMPSLLEKLQPVKFEGSESTRKIDLPLRPEFTKSFSVFTNNAEKALKLIDSGIADRLLAEKKYSGKLHIAIRNNMLLIAVNRHAFSKMLSSETELQQFLDFAKGIKERILRNA